MVTRRVPKKVKEIVRAYRSRLMQNDRTPIKRAILFGSHARHQATRWSDIDVCLISPRFKDSLEATRFLLHERNEQEVRAGLEPIGFSPADFREGSSLIDEIKRTGVDVM